MESRRELRLFTVGTRQDSVERAALLIDRLASLRAVDGEVPEWRVRYRADDVNTAFALCAGGLDLIDPVWVEVLDFEAVAPRPLSEAEFS